MVDTDELVAECIAAVAEPEPRLAVREILRRAVREPAGYGGHVGFDVLYAAPDLTVMDVVWPPLAALVPHDHRMWAVIGIYAGQEDNTFYRRDGTTIVESGGKEMREGDVSLLGDDVVHRVTNPTRRPTGGLHVYGGDLFGVPRSQWMGSPLREQAFDAAEAQREFERADARARAITPQ
jgi:predicted metal-dependent enzyme (double-stranded beta helix superfamily)